MGGCQNYLFGYPKYQGPYYNRGPKKDHNFDNHPYGHPLSLGGGGDVLFWESSAKMPGR